MAKTLLTMPRVWRLIRAGQVDPNPTTVVRRAGTSAASAPDGTVLVTRRNRDGLAHYLIAPQTPASTKQHCTRAGEIELSAA